MLITGSNYIRNIQMKKKIFKSPKVINLKYSDKKISLKYLVIIFINFLNFVDKN